MVLVTMIGLIIFLTISLKRPLWGLGIVLAALPVYQIRLNILNIPTTLLELMLGVFFIAVALQYLNRLGYNKIRSLRSINFLVLCFVMAGLISVFVSPETTRALGQFKAFILEPVLFFYAIILIVKNPTDYNVLLKSLFGAASLISLFAIIQYWTHVLLPLRFWGYGLEVKRITSIFEYPNALALYLAPILVMFVVLYFKKVFQIKLKWVAIGFALMVIALLLTYSRGAWLGVGGSLLLFSFSLTGVSWRRWMSFAAIAVILLAPLTISRIKNTFNDGSSSERISLYQAATNQIIQNPLLGNGLYGFRTTLQNSPDYHGEILNYPHNIVLNFWLETGLLGLLSIFLLVFFASKQYSTNPNSFKLAALFFLTTVIIHGLVDAPYFKNDLSLLFWFALAVALAPPEQNKQKTIG